MDVMAEWRKLHNKELHNLYSEHVACMGEERKLYKVLVGIPEGKRPLERPRCRWEDEIGMDLRETGWVGGRGLDLTGSG
jgi:hypothetical protein